MLGRADTVFESDFFGGPIKRLLRDHIPFYAGKKNLYKYDRNQTVIYYNIIIVSNLSVKT